MGQLRTLAIMLLMSGPIAIPSAAADTEVIAARLCETAVRGALHRQAYRLNDAFQLVLSSTSIAQPK